MLEKVRVILVLFVIILLISCRTGVNDTENYKDEKGAFLIKIAQNDIPSEVDHITAKIERNGFDTNTKQFEVVEGYVSVAFENIFIGEWHLSVTAYSSEDDALYFGESDVEIKTGSNQISLTLNPVTGSLEINLSFNTSTDSKLLAYYPFNGNANDESGNGNNGTVYGAQLTEDRFGNDNSAYYFDGNNDYIDVGSNIKPQFPISISLWVKAGEGFGKSGLFVNNFDNSNYYGVFLLLQDAGNISWHYGNGGGIGAQSRFSKSGNKVLTSNQWYHIVAIAESSQKMKLFINSEEDEGYTHGYANQMAYSDGTGRIGLADSDTGENSLLMKGVIDDIRVYNKVLTQDEISDLYLEN